MRTRLAPPLPATVAAVAAVLCLAFVAGCASSPAAVAEHTLDVANQSTQTFLKFDAAHRAEMKAAAPDEHAAAESIRPRYLDTFIGAHAAIERYKQTRTDADRLSMTNAVTAAQKIGQDSDTALTRARTLGVGGGTTPTTNGTP